MHRGCLLPLYFFARKSKVQQLLHTPTSFIIIMSGIDRRSSIIETLNTSFSVLKFNYVYTDTSSQMIKLLIVE